LNQPQTSSQSGGLVTFWRRRSGVVIAATIALGCVVGIAMGYDAAGVGGAMLIGAVFGLGGLIMGKLVVNSVILLRRAWVIAVTIVAFAALTALTWGMRL
jgi:hypothetical protein